VATAAIVCNLVITIPCVWGAFSKFQSFADLAAAGFFFCFVFTVGEVSLLATMSNELEIFDLITMNVSLYAMVWGTFAIFRLLGFQLIRTPKP